MMDRLFIIALSLWLTIAPVWAQDGYVGVVNGGGGGGGGGGVSSLTGTCGANVPGAPATGAVTVSAVNQPIHQTSGNIGTGASTNYCGNTVYYDAATDQSPTIPTSLSSGVNSFFTICNINAAQTLTHSGSDTFGITGAATTKTLPAGTTTAPNCIAWEADGVSVWAPTVYPGAGGGGSPGGSNTQVQYNNSSAFGGISGVTTNGVGLQITANGALSSGNGPALTANGTWITSGTGTTTKPYILVEPTGTSSTAWNTSGTGIGVNSASGFTGLLLDLQNGGTSQLRVTQNGGIVGNTFQFTSGTTSGSVIFNGNSEAFSSNGSFNLWNNAVTGWSSAGTVNNTYSADTGISRISAGVIGFGTGAAASVAGTIEAVAAAIGGCTISTNFFCTGPGTTSTTEAINFGNSFGITGTRSDGSTNRMDLWSGSSEVASFTIGEMDFVGNALLNWTNTINTFSGSSVDTGIKRNAAGIVEANNGSGCSTAANCREFKARSYLVGGSTPTLTGTCTTASQTGGNTAGTFTATCTSQTVIITFGFTAPNGWSCNAHDLTTPADTLNQTSSAAGSCTLTGTTVATDTISFNAVAY